MKNQKIQIFVVLMISIVSVAYSDEYWDLKKLSTAIPNAKAWLVQIQGDSVLVRKKASQKVLQKNHVPYLIDEGDLLVTGMDDRATILLRDGSVVWVNYMTIFKFSKMSVPSLVPGQSTEDYEVNLKLKVGGVRVKVPKVRTVQKKFTVETPQGLAAVRGTEEVVQYSPELGTRIQVLSGLVSVENQDKRVEYASRGQKVAVNVETSSGSETVNQQKRSQVQKNIQANSGSKEVQTVASIPALIPAIVPTPKTALPEPLGVLPPLKAPLSAESIELRDILRKVEAHPVFTRWGKSSKDRVHAALSDDQELLKFQAELSKSYPDVHAYRRYLKTSGFNTLSW